MIKEELQGSEELQEPKISKFKKFVGATVSAAMIAFALNCGDGNPSKPQDRKDLCPDWSWTDNKYTNMPSGTNQELGAQLRQFGYDCMVGDACPCTGLSWDDRIKKVAEFASIGDFEDKQSFLHMANANLNGQRSVVLRDVNEFPSQEFRGSGVVDDMEDPSSKMTLNKKKALGECPTRKIPVEEFAFGRLEENSVLKRYYNFQGSGFSNGGFGASQTFGID